MRPLPGPRSPAFAQTYRFATDRFRFSRECRARYGKDFQLKLLGRPPLVVISSHESVAKLFALSATDARAGEAYSPGAPIVGPGSLLMLDGSRHLTERRALLPSFHGQGIEAFSRVVEEVTDEALATWPHRAETTLWPRMQAITLDVILRAIFGIRDEQRSARLRELLPRMINVPPATLIIPALQRDLGPRSPWGRMVRARREVDEILFAEIRRRRAVAGDDARTDVLSVLLGAKRDDGSALSDQELRDELITLVLAGHDTTATALSWAFERLMRHPVELERLRDDADGSFTDAVIKETLRVRPVVANVARVLHQPFELDAGTAPAGATVLASAELLHDDDSVYPDPTAFLPQRFLDGVKLDSFAWLPFGGGVRRCLGAAFATAEMRIVLGAVVRSFDLTPVRADSERARIRAVVQAPDRSCEVVLRRRPQPTATDAPTGSAVGATAE